MNLIDNGGFSHGTMPGIMGHEGRTEGWTNRSGLPELIPDECGDPYAVLLHGLCSPIDIDIIDHRVEITGDMNGLSFNACYQLTEENWRPGTQLVLRLADEPQETGICQGECSELGRLQLDPTPSGEWNTASGSFLLDGLTGQKYLTLHIENDLADPENENSALVQLDNICLEMNESDTVGVQTEYAPIVPFTIYPNPNRGDFTVELTDVVHRPMSVQIVSLIGEVIAQQSLTSGKRKHHIQLGDVPAGMYFFQIQSNGQTLNSGKFVKQ